ncbi:MAG: NAD(P)/FAD-dependent oxidoreductase [Pseudomonadales bacterium]
MNVARQLSKQTILNDVGYIDSYYSATANAHEKYPDLEGDISADVCVIGGGYTGLSAALHLAQRGYSVALLEAQRVGWGASGRNGGHVGTGQRSGQQVLEKQLGDHHARQLWDLSVEAVDLVKDLISTHNIQCDLKHGQLHVAAKRGDTEELKQEVDHLRGKYGYQQMRYVDKEEVDTMQGSKKFFGGQVDEGSAHLHPLNFLLGMAAAAKNAGVKIFEASRVTDIEKNDPAVVSTEHGSVKAKFVVLGCNGYLGNLEAKMAHKIMPINNFVLATEPLSDDQAHELIRDDVAVSDTFFVINYWKLSADNRLLFGGGENYTSSFPSDLKTFVRKYMLRVYPQLENTRIDYAWGGTLAITLKRMPHFGRLAPNVFYAQGYSGHGVPTATMAGKLMAEAVSGTAERFDVMASVPTYSFPGGTLLRWPGLVAGMLYYSLRDRL